MKLSKRLEEILKQIPSAEVLVDVGTDHGLLIIEAIIRDKVKHAYGLDIAEGPLNQAKVNVLENGLTSKITLEQRNGLQGFNALADVFVVAGMGAETIWDIVKDYPFKKENTIILQPNSKEIWLRKQLSSHGFKIIHEEFLFDRNKPVFIEVLNKGFSEFSLEELVLGPFLDKSNDDYFSYLKNRYTHLKQIITFNASFKEEFEIIEAYLGKETIT